MLVFVPYYTNIWLLIIYLTYCLNIVLVTNFRPLSYIVRFSPEVFFSAEIYAEEGPRAEMSVCCSLQGENEKWTRLLLYIMYICECWYSFLWSVSTWTVTFLGVETVTPQADVGNVENCSNQCTVYYAIGSCEAYASTAWVGHPIVILNPQAVSSLFIFVTGRYQEGTEKHYQRRL